MIEFKSLVNLVSLETGIKQELVEEALRHKYNWLREQLVAADYPAILDSKFGSFILSEKRLQRFVAKYPDDLAHAELYNKIHTYKQSRKQK